MWSRKGHVTFIITNNFYYATNLEIEKKNSCSKHWIFLSSSAVDALIRKHGEFSKLLESQLSRVQELQQFAEEVQARGHYHAKYIQDRMESIVARRDRLQVSASSSWMVAAVQSYRNYLQKQDQQFKVVNIFLEVPGWKYRLVQRFSNNILEVPADRKSLRKRTLLYNLLFHGFLNFVMYL